VKVAERILLLCFVSWMADASTNGNIYSAKCVCPSGAMQRQPSISSSSVVVVALCAINIWNQHFPVSLKYDEYGVGVSGIQYTSNQSGMDLSTRRPQTWFQGILRCESKKGATLTMAITLSILGGFAMVRVASFFDSWCRLWCLWTREWDANGPIGCLGSQF